MISLGSKAAYGYDPTDGEGVVASRRARRSSRRARVRSPATAWCSFRPASTRGRSSPCARTDAVTTCAWKARARRAQQAVAAAGRRPALHGQRQRHRHLPRRADGTEVWHVAADRQLLGVPGRRGRAHLFLQRGRQDHRHRGGPRVQGARARIHSTRGSWPRRRSTAPRSTCGRRRTCIASRRASVTRRVPRPCHAPDRVRPVVADEQRAVLRGRDADRASPRIAVVGHEPGEEVLVLAGGGAVGLNGTRITL